MPKIAPEYLSIFMLINLAITNQNPFYWVALNFLYDYSYGGNQNLTV